MHTHTQRHRHADTQTQRHRDTHTHRTHVHRQTLHRHTNLRSRQTRVVSPSPAAILETAHDHTTQPHCRSTTTAAAAAHAPSSAAHPINDHPTGAVVNEYPDAVKVAEEGALVEGSVPILTPLAMGVPTQLGPRKHIKTARTCFRACTVMESRAASSPQTMGLFDTAARRGGHPTTTNDRSHSQQCL